MSQISLCTESRALYEVFTRPCIIAKSKLFLSACRIQYMYLKAESALMLIEQIKLYMNRSSCIEKLNRFHLGSLVAAYYPKAVYSNTTKTVR